MYTFDSDDTLIVPPYASSDIHISRTAQIARYNSTPNVCEISDQLELAKFSTMESL